MIKHTIMKWQYTIMPFTSRDAHVLLAASAFPTFGGGMLALRGEVFRVAQGCSVPISGGGPPVERDR
ncbi:hypothetical protein [Ktedonospora formicarum]|uniref:Uncharacterized protein n=1 Tax=Ktedonospora formicarum TaxID=2778364 RepID=A0A8J3HXW7_9CHLR|nr:hypothetical protein [Ktedonospora formicarum]GHO42983.1 hypothetical protein KSX_11460 [Ktedonospora formicarum]